MAAGQARGSATGGVTVVVAGEPVQDQEDECANARAVSGVLLAPHSRELAGYRRAPEFLRTSGGFEAVGIQPEERFVAVIHLGWPRQEKQPPERVCRPPAAGPTL